MEAPDAPPFFTLPSELIHHILGLLSLPDLLSVGQVNRALREHSLQDTLYHPFVQSHVPGVTLSKPLNSTWCELYKSHHPYWFIPKHKIWFADNIHTGKLMIARYNHRLNIIEGYALVAERRQPTFHVWDWNPETIIHTFSPHIQLDLNAPILRLDPQTHDDTVEHEPKRLPSEVPMPIQNDPLRLSAASLYSCLLLTRPWPEGITSAGTPVWPPLILPSKVRTRNDSPSKFRDDHHRPTRLSELSTKTFRIRKWIEFSTRTLDVSMRVGEELTTWATLPEECYTPTPQKPWQGIWCGDYAGHGCEFLLVRQPDNPLPLPQRAEWAMQSRYREGSVGSSDSWDTAHSTPPAEVEAEESSEAQSPTEGTDMNDSAATLPVTSPQPAEDGTVYRGRIEAVKLTGDPNIPRGEYTFIAPDIGPEGLIRVATEDMFKGARIVKSVGHIAARNFRDDDYISSQLILMSHDRLAQYWEPFGHVSFYQRVNIDEYTKVA